MKTNIKKIRTRLKMSQNALAKAIGIKQPAVAGYEIGVRNPSIATAKAIIALARKHNIKLNLDDIYK